jgi:hypothetical protein
MNELLHQLLGIAVTLISAGVFVIRYGIPSTGMSFVYLTFGAGFVLAGVAMGKMMKASTISLLLLEEWNFNLSLMAIGYSAVISGLLGIGIALYNIFPHKDEDTQP